MAKDIRDEFYSPKVEKTKVRHRKLAKGKVDESGYVDKPPKGISRFNVLIANKAWDSGPSAYPKIVDKFFKGRVGQKWNDVYKEICKSCNKKTDIGRLFIEYLLRKINLHVLVHEGIPCYKDQSKLNANGTFCKIFEQYYVHPETGVICKTPKDTKVEKSKLTPKVIDFNDFQYWLDPDTKCWYQVYMKVSSTPKKTKTNLEKYYMKEEIEKADRCKLLYGYPPSHSYETPFYWYPSFKKSLNSKEIKKLKEFIKSNGWVIN